MKAIVFNLILLISTPAVCQWRPIHISSNTAVKSIEENFRRASLYSGRKLDRFSNDTIYGQPIFKNGIKFLDGSVQSTALSTMSADNLGNHIATMTISTAYWINSSSAITANSFTGASIAISSSPTGTAGLATSIVGSIIDINGISPDSTYTDIHIHSIPGTQLYLSANGAIGIGNPSPAYPLDVTGLSQFSDTITAIKGIATSTLTATGNIQSNGSFYGSGSTLTGIIQSSATGTYALTSTKATALASDPSNCTGVNFATGINASGTADCAQPSNVTGSAATVTSAAQTNITSLGTLSALSVSGATNFPGSGIWNASGNVGIGTTDPTEVLQVAGQIRTNSIMMNKSGEIDWNAYYSSGYKARATGEGFQIYGENGGGIKFSVAPSTTADGELSFTSALLIKTNGETEFTGNLGIGGIDPSHKIHITGGAYCDGTGDWIAGSDRTYKTNISSMSYGLKEILKLNSIKFVHKADKKKILQLGFIADDVKPIIPEVVDGVKGSYGLAYSRLIPVLVNAIKEQNTIILELKKRVSALENK